MINGIWSIYLGMVMLKQAKPIERSGVKWINDYIVKREVLQGIFVLIDARHDPQKIDMEFLEWLGEEGIPFTMVFTKTDKLSASKLPQAIAAYRKSMLRTWEEMPTHFVTSAISGLGCQEILNFYKRCK